MRNFDKLDHAVVDTATGIITFKPAQESASNLMLSMRREGEYVVISASYGPLEIALRSRYRELVRTLVHIQPNDGLITTRQVGTGEAFLALGRRTDGTLIARPTVVGDASGHFCINLSVAPKAVETLMAWLGGEEND